MSQGYGKRSAAMIRRSNDFSQRRATALLSLDKTAIDAVAAEWAKAIENDPLLFWCAVHKARLELHQCPQQLRAESCQWLESHGFTLSHPDGWGLTLGSKVDRD